MADCRESHASLAEIVCPARDRLSAQIFTAVASRQAIDILTLQQDVLGIFVIRYKMLFVVHHEVLNIARDGMLLVYHRHLERTQGRMRDVRPTHHLAIVLGRKRNVAAIVEGVQRSPSLHEVFDGCTLLLRYPALGLLLRPVSIALQLVRVFIVVGLKISVGPDHSIAQNYKKAVRPQKARGYLIVVNGVIKGEIKVLEEFDQSDPDVVGVVITVADEGKNPRTLVIGGDGTALFPRIQENSRRR